jgi:hypothetical protein
MHKPFLLTDSSACDRQASRCKLQGRWWATRHDPEVVGGSPLHIHTKTTTVPTDLTTMDDCWTAAWFTQGSTLRNGNQRVTLVKFL